MIEGMGHVCIGALDLGETERFYCEALGFRKLFRFLRDGQEIGFYLALPDGSFVEVFKEDDAKVSPQGLIRHLCLRVDDLDATIAALGARGIEAVGKKLGADRSWQAWIEDPSGVRIELHQYTDESRQQTGGDCVLG